MKYPLLYYGENSYALRHAVREQHAAFVRAEGDMNIAVIDGKATNSSRIISAAEALPFLGTRRLVIVHDYDFTKADDALLAFVKSIPEHCALIFVTAKADGRTALFKAIKKYGDLHEYAIPKPAEFIGWLRSDASDMGLTLQPDALELLALFTSGDCETAHHELEKLQAYASEPTLTKDMVEAVVHPDLHTSVFRLTDLIGSRNIGSAIATLTDLHQRGENLMQVLYMIVRQVRILLSIRALLARNTPSAAIASELKLHPFVVKNSLSQARNFSDTELIATLTTCRDIDASIKTGKLHYSAANQDELALAIERLMLRFA